jgi:hypothetical protein
MFVFSSSALTWIKPANAVDDIGAGRLGDASTLKLYRVLNPNYYLTSPDNSGAENSIPGALPHSDAENQSPPLATGIGQAENGDPLSFASSATMGGTGESNIDRLTSSHFSTQFCLIVSIFPISVWACV